MLQEKGSSRRRPEIKYEEIEQSRKIFQNKNRARKQLNDPKSRAIKSLNECYLSQKLST